MNTTQKIRELEHQLKNNPNGIPYKDLPTEEVLVNYMKGLLAKNKAIWLEDFEGNFTFILMRDPYTAPMDKTKWKWVTKKGTIETQCTNRS